MLVEGDVWVVDSGFKVDLGRLEWVFGWKNKEKLEFAALRRISVSKRGIEEGLGIIRRRESLRDRPS